jgi:hypothetical protein
MMGVFARMFGWVIPIQLFSIVFAFVTSAIQTKKIIKKGNQIMGVGGILGLMITIFSSAILAKKD